MGKRDPRPLPPIAELRAVFSYEPETGVIMWRERADMPLCWNARQAGKPAGCITPNGYLQIRYRERGYRHHRIAWALHHGIDPGAMTIDHANRNPLDNRALNLRLASKSENQRNRTRQPGKLLPKGVKFDRARGKYKAMIRIGGGRRLESARYDTPEAAHAAYRALAVKHHGEFARFD